MKITAHCLLKNEDRWVWYSILSVLDHVDEVMVWDTGSTDSTAQIIKTITSPKIKFMIRPASTPRQVTQARQEMLDSSKTDWLMILDGDEIWTLESLSQSISAIQTNPNLGYLINSFSVLLGDVFHHQEDRAGKYQIGPYSGHISIRFINLKLLSPLHYVRGYPDESLNTSDGRPLQNLSEVKARYIQSPYLHTTHLPRTSKPDFQTISRSHRLKYELGIPMASDFPYPYSFYFPRPKIVPSPWTKRSWTYFMNAAWQTPLKLLKRRI